MKWHKAQGARRRGKKGHDTLSGLVPCALGLEPECNKDNSRESCWEE